MRVLCIVGFSGDIFGGGTDGGDEEGGDESEEVCVLVVVEGGGVEEELGPLGISAWVLAIRLTELIRVMFVEKFLIVNYGFEILIDIYNIGIGNRVTGFVCSIIRTW